MGCSFNAPVQFCHFVQYLDLFWIFYFYSVCMCVYGIGHLCVPYVFMCPWRPERVIRCHGPGIIGCCVSPDVCYNPNFNLLKKKYILLITEKILSSAWFPHSTLSFPIFIMCIIQITGKIFAIILLYKAGECTTMQYVLLATWTSSSTAGLHVKQMLYETYQGR